MVQGLTIGPLVKKLASDASEAREKNALDVDA
jgi:hypothetical protein